MPWSLFTDLVRGLTGPVAAFDLVRSARQQRFYWLRVLYPAGMLLVLLYLVSIEFQLGRHQTDLARLAEKFFLTFTFLQGLAIFVLTPTLLAGSVAREKESRTLEFVLATDLSGEEIVFGKLAARMAALLMLLVAGLPVFSIVQSLGGVEPRLVFAVFLASAVTALSLAALCLAISVESRKARQAIALGYRLPIVYVLISGLPWALQTTPPLAAAVPLIPSLTWADLLFPIGWGNPFVQANLIAGPAIYDDLPLVLTQYLGFHGVATVLFLSYAAWRLRPAGLRDAVPVAAPTKQHAAMARPPLGDQPIYWKERYIEGLRRHGWWQTLALTVVVVVTFTPVAFIAALAMRQHVDGLLNLWVRTMTVLIGVVSLLGIAVRSAGAVISERDRQTLDLLLTTPLTCREILFDKTWANLVVRWPVVLWLGSIWFVGWLGGGVRLEMFPVLVVFWGLYAWATSAIGLWASLFARSAQQATMMAVVLTIIFMGGHLLITGPCCLYPTSELLVGFVFGVTPPVVLGTLPMMEYAELNRYLSASFTLLPFLILGLMIWFALGCSYWESALTLFEQQTHRRAK